VRISADRYLWISTLLFSVFQQIRILDTYKSILKMTDSCHCCFNCRKLNTVFPDFFPFSLTTMAFSWLPPYTGLTSNCSKVNYQSVLSKQYALIYLSDASIATHHQVSFDGLDKSKRIDFDRSAMPLLQIGARRMALQVTLHHTDKRTNIHTHIHTLGTHSTNWKSPLTQNTCFTAI